MAVTILIVEDEFIIAQDLEETVTQLGYEVISNVSNYNDAIYVLGKNTINIALLDVNLNDKKDGIDIAHYINDNMKIPFVFITSNADKTTVDRAKQTNPNGYIVKPFNKDAIYTTIEMALANFYQLPTQTKKEDESFYIKDGTTSVQLHWKHVLYVKSEANYIAIVTESKKYLIRKSLKEFISTIPHQILIQAHKSFVINTKAIKEIHSNYVMIKDTEIPIGREFKEAVLALVNKP